MLRLIIAVSLLIGSSGHRLPQEVPATRPAAPRALPPVEDFSDVTSVTVVEVLSGDSLVVETRRGRILVRCYAIQAQREDGPAAALAREFLSNLLSGEEVYLKYERPAHADEDPRRAYVFRAPDGLFVNAELVRQGYAAVDAGAPSRFREHLDECEHRARAATKGIWSILRPPKPAPPPESQPAATKPADPEPPATTTRPIATPSPSHGTVSQTVYVTRSGSKYHRANCSFARKGATAISLQEALDKGLTPCSRCKP